MKTLKEAVQSLVNDIEAMQMVNDKNWFGRFPDFEDAMDGASVEWPNLAISLEEVKQVLAQPQKIDPELELSLPSPFVLSIEPCGRDAYQHGYHLGTHEQVARAFAEEIWKRVNGTIGCYTVALISDGEIFDVYDGRDWKSALDDRMYAESAEDASAEEINRLLDQLKDETKAGEHKLG